MTKELYEKLNMAGKALCEYCENDECSCCQVTRLMDDAYIEAVEEGIVDDALKIRNCFCSVCGYSGKGLQYWRFGMQLNTEKLQLLFFRGCEDVFHNFC